MCICVCMFVNIHILCTNFYSHVNFMNSKCRCTSELFLDKSGQNYAPVIHKGVPYLLQGK